MSISNSQGAAGGADAVAGGSAKGRFEEWLRTPFGDFAALPGYAVRRAEPQDFDAIYDLLDHAFDTRRPRALFEWLYRHNPQGPARCVNVVETATNQMVCTATRFPWAAALGDRLVPGMIAGDVAVRDDARNRGIGRLQFHAWRSHPASAQSVVVGWPNEISVEYTRRGGEGDTLAPLRSVALKLRSPSPRSWLASARRRLGAAPGAGRLRLESVAEFDERFTRTAARFLRSDGVWHPRDAAFLTWRYLAHPLREYRSLALLRGDELVGFCVVNLDGKRATLMELAAPRSEAPRLLAAAADAARAAGCRRLEFFATEGFPQWASLRDADFAERGAGGIVYLVRQGQPDPSGDAWSVTPGETEVL